MCGAQGPCLCHQGGARRLQAGGVPFSVGKLHCAMQTFVRCRFAYLASRTCAHVSTLEVRPFLSRMEFALCSADVGVMTGANKQTQWFFGPTLSSVVAQSESAGERVVRNSAAWPQSTYILALCIYNGCSSSTRYFR